jgi:hypothetical protein
MTHLNRSYTNSLVRLRNYRWKARKLSSTCDRQGVCQYFAATAKTGYDETS